MMIFKLREINEQIKKFFLTLKGSCLSFDFYKQAAKLPVYKAFVYIVLFTFFAMLLVSAVIFITVQKDLKPFLKELSLRMPECTIQEGVMSVLPNDTVIVDRSLLALAVYPGKEKGEIERILRHLDARNSVVLTEEEVIVKDPSNVVSLSWNDITKVIAFNKITGKHFEALLLNMDVFLFPLFFIMIFFFFIWDFFQIIYFTAFGYLFSRISELRLLPEEKTGMAEIFNIAVYSSTPAAVLLFVLFSFTQLFYFQLKPDHIQLVYMLMYALFFLGGYNAYRSTVKSDERKVKGRK